MRINHKILSIPPYISTSWKNVVALQSNQENGKTCLTIYLQDTTSVEIPELDSEIVRAIFAAHAKYVENEMRASIQEASATMTPLLEPEMMQSMLKHDEGGKHSPNLPEHILNKVSQICKEMGLSQFQTIPSPEPHCNCPHCQIARSIQHAFLPLEEPIEEEVSDEDLTFCTWIIQPLEKNLYKVIHPDNPKEIYRVFLDSPIGCTCGSDHCEHIQAVLCS